MIRDIVLNEAARWNVPPSWISAIIRTESRGNPNSIGRGDCARGECSYGLMGMELSRARDKYLRGLMRSKYIETIKKKKEEKC